MSEESAPRATPGESQGPSEAPPGSRRDAPYRFAVVAGRKYAYCRCGNSQRLPLCDGSHREIGDGTEVTPIKVIAERDGEFVWCACGRSGGKPDCDGSHGVSRDR